MPVGDLVAQWHRTSDDTWQAEMLCQRPSRAETVYPNFALARHVRELTTAETTPGDASKDAGHEVVEPAPTSVFIAGMDFGLRSPAVWLWARLVEGETPEPVVYVVDGYQQAGRTLDQHLQAIDRRAQQQGWPRGADLAWVGIDPAGHQRSSHTGLSDVEVLARHHLHVRARRAPLRDGLERVRRRLDRGTLLIHPRCTTLIEAMRTYHFDTDQPRRDHPVKDGPDHACDALRYMILNLELGPRPVQVRSWA